MTNDLYVTDETTVEELQEYVAEVIADPHVVEVGDEEKRVWNFSSHPINENSLNLDMKYESEFIIPFGVTSTWAIMYVLLPERLRSAEILVWNQDSREYRAYNQFYNELSNYEINVFRQDMVGQLESNSS